MTLPGSNLLANSRPVASPPPGDQLNEVTWRGAIITPDGRSVVIVEELASNSASVKVRDRLLKVSVATGRVTVVNDLNILAATSTSRSCTPARPGASWSSAARARG